MYKISKITSNTTIDFAAEELKKYLRMMMPRCGEIPVNYVPGAKDGFRIGIMADFGLDTSDAKDVLLDDIIYIDADENGGIIAGSNPVATLIAVYRYLRFCGCRWLFPGIDGEWIPMVETLPCVNYRKLADHRYRGQCNEGAEYQPNMIETIDFTPKIGMNTYMLEFDNPYCYYNSYYDHTNSKTREPEPVHRDTVLQWKRQCEAEIQKRGLHYHDMGHGWTAEPFGIDSSRGWALENEDIVPEESRKFLAQINGERKLFNGVPLFTNICMSNPEARRIMANYIADYAEKQNNVDFLHIWLADTKNNHCECDECKKKVTADWYLILLNEIDEELASRNLDTHLVFIVYVDTFWPPVETKLNNNKRFTMLFAPITRLYTETYGEEPDFSKVIPYNRNKLVLPQGMGESLAYLQEWKKIWSGDCFCYEYHFMDFQYQDPSGLYMAELISKDIKALRKNGLSGIIEDGSQRSYFPTGFSFYVYGETLFDADVSFEELKEDYFSHAFGENWQAVVRYLEAVRDRLPFNYFFGKASQSEESRYYLPELAPKAKEIHGIADEFAKVIKENKNQYYRAASVAWRVLEAFNDAVDKMATITEYKAVGDHKNTIAAIDEMIYEMSEKEIYIERYYDQYLFTRQWERLTEGMRDKVDNLIS